MAADKKEAEKDGGGSRPEKPPESPWLTVVKEAGKQLVGVLLTGAGLIGFVAFAGAVIVWTRFEAIEVPPDQVVKAVPRDELVASGASLLLIFGFFGALAVLATYLVDRGGRATPGMSRVLLALVAAEGIAAIVLTGELSWKTVAIGIVFPVLVAFAVLSTFSKSFARYKDELKSRPAETEEPVRGRNSLFDPRGDPRFSLGWLIVVIVLLAFASGGVAVQVLVALGTVARVCIWVGVAALLFTALAVLGWLVRRVKASEATDDAVIRDVRTEERAEAEAQARRKREEEAETLPGWVGVRVRDLQSALQRLRALGRFPDPAEENARAEERRLGKRRPHRLELNLLGVALMLSLAAVTIVVPAAMIGRWWLAVSFAACFILAAGLWRVAVLSRVGFFWFGLVTFVSVPLFGTLTLMARNVEKPQVQPVALIRTTDGPGESIQGVYVTEASNRVYFANVATKGCTDEVVKNSGRLLWVPKKEVVAMAIGPLQDIKDAGRSALEMSYALTPGVETPTGTLFDAKADSEGSVGVDTQSSMLEESADDGSTDAEETSKPGDSEAESPVKDDGNSEGAADGEADAADEGKAEEEDPTDRHRLETAGPAVRPSFGRGLKLVPDAAEPGDIVELRMSDPENGGFGNGPNGYNLRLNGVELDVLRVSAQSAQRAEYVETEGGMALRLRSAPEAVAKEHVVRLRKDAGAKTVNGGYTLRLDGDELAEGRGEPPAVVLANGEREPLQSELLRRAWSPTRIKFEVPEGAESGPIAVECGQLAGQPVLTVVQPPKARIAVRMRPGSARVRLDSRASGGTGEGSLTRRWKVAGRRFGDRETIKMALPARLSPYKARLTVSDESGRSDSVELRILRLPASKFPLGDDHPASAADVKKVRRALGKALEQGTPQEIELAGHADAVASDHFNVVLSRKRVERLRRMLFASRPKPRSEGSGGTHVPADLKRLVNPGEPIPLVALAFGESCPVIPSPGPQQANRRVEVFLLGQGAVVKPGRGCHAARITRVSW